MNGRNVDEVVVKVESKDEGSFNVPPPPPPAAAAAPWHSRDLKPNSSPQIKAIQSSNGRASGGADPRIHEDLNDAIWEEPTSPLLQPRASTRPLIDSTRSVQVSTDGLMDAFDAARMAPGRDAAFAKATPSAGRRPLSVERVPTQSSSPPRLSPGAAVETRRCSLDSDIHINEPNLVSLQDTPACKPASDHFSAGDFSFRPKRSDSQIEQTPPSNNSQRIVRVVSSSKLKTPSSPLQPRETWCRPSELRVDEDDFEEGSERRPSDVTSSRSQSTRKLIDPGMPLADGRLNSARKRDDEGRTMEAPSVAANEKTNRVPRTVTPSKELLKTKTKSRLVEGPSPRISNAVAASGRLEGAKKSAPQSPGMPSQRKTEALDAEEEDPFKGVELQDKFMQGNFKAITIAQWAAFIVVMGGLVCSLTVKVLKGRQLWGLELWRWFLLVLVVLCGRLVSGWIIRILVIIFEKNFLLRKKVLYFVYGLRKGVQNCLWLGLALLAWKLIFDPRVETTSANHKTLVFITRLLECFVIAAFIWLAKLLVVKSLASSFHVATFFDRIQESLYNQNVLEILLGPPLLDLSFEASHKRAPNRISLARGAAGKKDDTSEPIKIENLKKMSTENVSAGVMKQLMNLVTHPGLGTLYYTFDESVYMDAEEEEIEINSELQAKAAAKRIFKNVAQEDAASIEKDDLLRFMEPEKIPALLCLFEGAKDTGKITKKALKNWVVKVYQERRALAHSLNDTKTAVKELHRMASVVVSIIIIVVWLLVLGIATTHVLLFVSSQLLLVGFMFSNTVKQVFEAIIFLFVMHPFDVGDRCIIDGTHLIVDEMKILSTVFLKADNEKVFYPNAVLALKPISNLFRSPEMKEFLDYSVHISTSTEKISAFKEKIARYVESKSEHWAPKFGVQVKELEDLNQMKLSVSLQHTINFQNFGDRISRRSELLLELKRIFAELGIEYRLLTQPVQLTYGQAAAPSVVNPYYPPPIYPYQGQPIPYQGQPIPYQGQPL